jgi:hypothetical protein
VKNDKMQGVRRCLECGLSKHDFREPTAKRSPLRKFVLLSCLGQVANPTRMGAGIYKLEATRFVRGVGC